DGSWRPAAPGLSLAPEQPIWSQIGELTGGKKAMDAGAPEVSRSVAPVEDEDIVTSAAPASDLLRGKRGEAASTEGSLAPNADQEARGQAGVAAEAEGPSFPTDNPDTRRGVAPPAEEGEQSSVS